MTDDNRPRTLGLVLVVWGVLGTLSVAGIVTLLSAPWFEGDTWEHPSLVSPLSFFAFVGLAGAATSLIAGIGLRRAAPWARPLAYFASVAALPTVPLGTIVGAYGLIVLLSSRYQTPNPSLQRTPPG